MCQHPEKLVLYLVGGLLTLSKYIIICPLLPLFTKLLTTEFYQPSFCDRIAPTPAMEVPRSTSNSFSKSGSASIGVVHKFFLMTMHGDLFSFLIQMKLSFLIHSVMRTTRLLNFPTNLRQKVASPWKNSDPYLSHSFQRWPFLDPHTFFSSTRIPSMLNTNPKKSNLSITKLHFFRLTYILLSPSTIITFLN